MATVFDILKVKIWSNSHFFMKDIMIQSKILWKVDADSLQLSLSSEGYSNVLYTFRS
jgi:hypothetical protein